MVSVQRAWRKLMKLTPGQSSLVGPLLELSQNGGSPPKHFDNTNPFSVYPMPPSQLEQPTPDNIDKLNSGSSCVSASNSTIEQHGQHRSGVKGRKPHRRKIIQNKPSCTLRGVYFKNMKWQAAIKVDKKQIHLGTFETPEEAGHLYDRAAFMCGWEPNLEVSEIEKQELRQLNWDEFLALTRVFASKKHHRSLPNEVTQ